jgi:hypothetical protein
MHLIFRRLHSQQHRVPLRTFLRLADISWLSETPTWPVTVFGDAAGAVAGSSSRASIMAGRRERISVKFSLVIDESSIRRREFA